MRICTEHWAALRKAIEDRGLYHLVAKSGAAAGEALRRLAEGTADPKEDFDPLMGANIAIVNAAVEDGGLAMLVGDLCPLCEPEKQRAGLAEEWINGAADDQLALARELGLVPLPS